MPEALASLPPGSILVLGAFLVPLLSLWKGSLGRKAQGALLLVLPILSGLHLLGLPDDHRVTLDVFDVTLELVRVDGLSLVWGYVFHLAALLAAIYALHVKDPLQHLVTFVYAGAAIGSAFAGDLITLFVGWELTAISSVFLIWASRTESAYRAGMRYLIIQVASGVALLAGALVVYGETGSLAFDRMELEGLGPWLIFLAFGVKCAFPLLHNWLQDAYPEATPTGTVVLSAFTTKLAVYAFARAFPGTELLIPIGVTMTLFPIFFAVIENDLRRVLAYSLNNQLGFMIVGVGIGTELSLNGTAAHAFAHILYKALLFMSMGAVLHRVGTIKASELGGLWRSMPWTAAFCIVGALSISGFPFFSGFVSKSMIMSAAGEGHMTWVWIGMLIASAGVVDHSGIKVPFFSFFAHDSGKRCEEAPLNMRVAMGVTAALCLGIGLFPGVLYAILPYPVDYQPYTGMHLLEMFQLLLFAALAFLLLLKTGIYPAEVRAVHLDTDWLYRKPLPALTVRTGLFGMAVWDALLRGGRELVRAVVRSALRVAGAGGVFSRTWASGVGALWAAVLLGLFLLLYYF